MSLERKDKEKEEKEKISLTEAISNYSFFNNSYKPTELFEESEM